MNCLKSLFLSLGILIFITNCTKTDTLDDPQTTLHDNLTGSLYIDCAGWFVRIGIKSGLIWSSDSRNLFGSNGNPMTFDTATFYHGNLYGLTAYSSQTGIPRWSFNWPAFDDAISYREPAFKDSLLFLTSPTNFMKHATLYCINKNNGARIWEKEIDSGNVFKGFNTTPMIVDNNVIVLTRNALSQISLSSFNATDASLAWKSEINDSLSFRLRLSDKKIYSTTTGQVICYDAVTGVLKWKTDLQQNHFKMTATFFEQNKIILVREANNDYTIFTLDSVNGNVINKVTIPVPTDLPYPDYASLGCNYRNNTFFVASRQSNDTTTLRSYDLSTLSMKWEKRFANYINTEFTPLLTDKHLVFPINDSYPNAKSKMYFLDLNGKISSNIPFDANYTAGFVYVVDGVIYKQENKFIYRYQSRK